MPLAASHSHSAHPGSATKRKQQEGQERLLWEFPIFSGNTRSSPWQNKQVKDGTWPWHQTETSTLLCQPLESHKTDFIHSCFLFLRDMFWEIFLTGLKHINPRKGSITRLMKREGGSCRDQNLRDFLTGEITCSRRKRGKSRGSSSTERLLRWRTEERT